MRRLFPLLAPSLLVWVPLTASAHPGHELLTHSGALLFAAGLVVGAIAAPLLWRSLRERRNERD